MVLVAAANAPDADLAWTVLGRDDAAFTPGGALHSLAAAGVLAGVLAAAFRRAAPALSWRALLELAALGLGAHLALDCLTARGTTLFWPLTSRRFALGWLHGADPALWALLGLGAAAAWAWPARGVAAAKAALWAAGAYMLACGMARATAVTRFEDAVVRLGARPLRAEAFPQFLEPLRYNVVVWAANERLFQAFVHASRGVEGRVRQYFTPPPAPPFDVPFARAYLAWARAPVLRRLAGPGPASAALYDLRFMGRAEGLPYVVKLTDEGQGRVRREWVPAATVRPPDADQEYELGR